MPSGNSLILQFDQPTILVGDNLVVQFKLAVKNNYTVYWRHHGLFHVVRREVIEECIRLAEQQKMRAEFDGYRVGSRDLLLRWDQTVPAVLDSEQSDRGGEHLTPEPPEETEAGPKTD